PCTSQLPSPTPHHPLSLHDALPILPSTLHRLLSTVYRLPSAVYRLAEDFGAEGTNIPADEWANVRARPGGVACRSSRGILAWRRDRKSTRLNSSHVSISYAVFCLTK